MSLGNRTYGYLVDTSSGFPLAANLIHNDNHILVVSFACRVLQVSVER